MRPSLPNLLLTAAISTSLSGVAVADTQHHDHHGHSAGHSHGVAAPIGVMGAHTHEAGEWMLSYRFMQMQMKGMRDGHNSLSNSDVLLPNGTYMATPLEMTMNMHMLGAMYAPTDDVTFMAMVPYISKEMDHRRANNTEFSTESSGIGDVSLSALVNIHKANGVSAHFTFGVGLPTGDIDQNDTPGHLPYPMQIGTGSYVAVTGLTVTSEFDSWVLGGQWLAKTPLDMNDNDYRVGESMELNTWAGFSVNNSFDITGRLSYENWQDYNGSDSELMIPAGAIATADPGLRGGSQLLMGFGGSFTIGRHRLAAEIELPLRRNLDGPQLETDTTVTLGYQVSF